MDFLSERAGHRGEVSTGVVHGSMLFIVLFCRAVSIFPSESLISSFGFDIERGFSYEYSPIPPHEKRMQFLSSLDSQTRVWPVQLGLLSRRGGGSPLKHSTY